MNENKNKMIDGEEFVAVAVSDEQKERAFWRGVWTGIGSVFFLSILFGGRKVVVKHHHHGRRK